VFGPTTPFDEGVAICGGRSGLSPERVKREIRERIAGPTRFLLELTRVNDGTASWVNGTANVACLTDAGAPMNEVGIVFGSPIKDIVYCLCSGWIWGGG